MRIIACLRVALLAVSRLIRVRLTGVVLVRIGLVRTLIGWRILLLVLAVRIYAVAGIGDGCRLIRRVTNTTPSAGGGQRLGLHLRRRRGWLGIQRILGPNEN